MKTKRAIVLLSGGLDSTVLLAQALSEGYQVLALTFDYEQNNSCELTAARALAEHYQVEQKIFTLDSQCFGFPSLASRASKTEPHGSKNRQKEGIPVTYIAARNTIFLAYAIGQAEIFLAEKIYFSASRNVHPLYPDTRPEYRDAFQGLVNLATKQAIEGQPPQLSFPFATWAKSDVVALGKTIQVPLEKTVSCYAADENLSHCGCCDACYLRKEAFIGAGLPDPTRYQEHGLPLGAASLGD